MRKKKHKPLIPACSINVGFTSMEIKKRKNGKLYIRMDGGKWQPAEMDIDQHVIRLIY